MIDPAAFPILAALAEGQAAAFPEHRGALERRFRDAPDLAFAEALAGDIAAIMGRDTDRYFADYRWLVGAVLEEELFFRREGRYRLSTFAEAQAQVYSDPVYMTRYMNGLLLSQLWWGNHTAVLAAFRDRFLPGVRPGARHLEIGPGHGLFLALAAADPRIAHVAGWDISPASLDLVRRSFAALSTPAPDLVLADLRSPAAGQFDSICFSEVLEHLEDPARALGRVAELLAPGGRLFVNAPVNSPAPDHITLFETPEAIVELVAGAGLEIEDTLFAAAAGAGLDRARRLRSAISTVVMARRPL